MDWSPGYREYAPPVSLVRAVSCLWVGVTPAAGALAGLAPAALARIRRITAAG